MGKDRTFTRALAKRPFSPADRAIHDKPGHLIRRLQQIAVAIFMDKTAGFEVTPAQYAALLAIHLHPGLDQTELMRLVAIDRSSIGAVIGRLEQKRLVRRKVEPEDRRSRVLFATPAGRKLLTRIEPGVLAAQRAIVAPLRADERTRFVRTLRRLVDLNNDHSRAPMGGGALGRHTRQSAARGQGGTGCT